MSAFKITIGHELAHKNNDFFKFTLNKKNIKFINWTNEVHADFMATHNMFMSNRQQLINSCIYKNNYKINSGKNIKDSFSHPSFETRQHCAENYDFNEKIIKKLL